MDAGSRLSLDARVQAGLHQEDGVGHVEREARCAPSCAHDHCDHHHLNIHSPTL